MLIFALELIERLNGYDLDCTRGHYGEVFMNFISTIRKRF